MPILMLQEEETTREYCLEKGRTFKIGRSPDNDMVIENSSVSAHHAEVESQGDRYFLIDRQSRNGSFVNKELAIFRMLKHRDVITIGNHTILFTFQEGENRPDDREERRSLETLTIDTVQHRGKLARSLAEMVSNEHEKEQTGVLTFLSGTREVVRLSKPLTTIGKSPAADVPVQGLMVGKNAAVITKKPNGYYIKYVEGKSKPKVNYKAVKSVVALQEFDVIEIGSVTMQFSYQ